MKLRKSAVIITLVSLVIILLTLYFLLNKSDNHYLKCRVDGGTVKENQTHQDIYFYFDDKNEKIIQEKIKYYYYFDEFDKQDITFQEDKEYYVRVATCNSIFDGYVTCDVKVEEERAIVNANFSPADLNKIFLVYNMDKTSLKKYLKERDIECN